MYSGDSTCIPLQIFNYIKHGILKQKLVDFYPKIKNQNYFKIEIVITEVKCRIDIVMFINPKFQCPQTSLEVCCTCVYS